jgi:hypothetical protein
VYNYLEQAKMSFIFSTFCKIEEQEGEQVLLGRVDTNGRVEEVGKRFEGELGANTVYT